MLRRCWPAVLLLLSGCILDPGRCVYQTRWLKLDAPLAGSALRPGDPPALGSLTLAEQEDGLGFRTLSASVETQAAVAITLVELREATLSGSRVLYTFPLGNGQAGIWGANVDLAGNTLAFEQLLFPRQPG